MWSGSAERLICLLLFPSGEQVLWALKGFSCGQDQQSVSSVLWVGADTSQLLLTKVMMWRGRLVDKSVPDRI
jgi:hypothetical protein